MHLHENHDDQIKIIKVGHDVHILAVSIYKFDSEAKYQVTIAGNYLAVRREDRYEMIV